jgi:VanZ family protein
LKKQQHKVWRAAHADRAVSAARDRVNFTWPVGMLVLAAIAIPVELRPFDAIELSWAVIPFDVIANILLFLPVGAVLAGMTFARAVAIAVAMTVLAETAQLFTLYRYPSPIDVLSNVAGAVAGWAAMRRFGLTLPSIPLRAATGVSAIAAALALLAVKAALDLDLAAERRSDDALIVNERGATAPGALEAHWTFDSVVAAAVADDSGRGLHGVLRGGEVIPGVRGAALDARAGAYADFGTSAALRLMGSVTVTAWINASDFPRDDAAIVSSQLPGFQLDTTIDVGPRVLAFKLTNVCANLMTRYGRTELERGRWYHVAGVYDADALTISVYIDGHNDDGVLDGAITAAQRASPRPVYVGARPDLDGFGFSGAIDDVTIHSSALNEREIRALMEGERPVAAPASEASQSTAGKVLARRLRAGQLGCHQPSRPSDALVPGVAVAIGMLGALALAAFRRTSSVALVGLGLAVGVVLVLISTFERLPAYVAWMLPAFTSIGAATIAASIKRASATRGRSASG